MPDLLVRIDATTAEFDRAMASAQKSALRYDAALKAAQRAQVQFDAAVAKSGASSAEAAAAQGRLTAALARTTEAEFNAGVASKRAGEIQEASAVKAAAAQDRAAAASTRAAQAQARSASAKAASLSREVAAFEAAAAAEIAAQERAAAAQAAAMKKIGTFAGGVGLAAAAALGLAAKAASDFNAEMAQVNSLLPDAEKRLTPALAAATSGFADIGVSASEAAAAEIELIKAGVSANDILGGALVGTLNAAAAGQIDVAQATEIASAAMVQFGLDGAAIPHVADLLAAGADKSLGGIADLGEGLKAVGTTAHQFGLSIDETVGALSQFAAAGLTGSLGGTALKQALLKLEAPSEKARDIMDEYSISLYDANGNTINTVDLAGQLQGAFKHVSAETRNAALATLFGSRAVQVANILYKDGAKVTQEWVDKVNDAGFAADQASGKMDSLQGDLQKLGAETTNAAIVLGQQLQPALRAVTQDLTSFVGLIADAPDWLKEAIGLTLAFTAAVGLGTFVYTRAAAGIGSMAATLGLVAKEAPAAAAGLTATNTAASGVSGKMLAIRGGAALAGIGLMTVASSADEVNTALGAAAKTAAGAALGFSVGGALGAAIGGGIGLVSAYVSALGDLNATLDTLRQHAATDPFDFAGISAGALGASESLNESADSTGTWADRLHTASSLAGPFKLGVDGIASALDHFSSSASDAANEAGILNAQNLVLKDNFALFAHDFLNVPFDAPFRDLNVAMKDALVRLTDLGFTVPRITKLLGSTFGQKILADALKDAGDAADGAAGDVDKLTGAEKRNAQAALDMTAALDANRDALTKRGDWAAYKDSIEAATKELKKHGTESIKAGTRAGDVLDQMASSANAFAANLSDHALTVYMTKARNDLYKVALGFTHSKDAATDYVNTVLGIPDTAKTKADFETQAAAALATSLLHQYDDLTGKQVKSFVEAIGAATTLSQLDGIIAKENYLQGKHVQTYVDTILRTISAPGGHSIYEPGATGGPVRGGIPGRDSVPRMLMPEEHIWTAQETKAVGGHGAMFELRAAARAGAFKQGMAAGGPPTWPGSGVSSMGGSHQVVVQQSLPGRVQLVLNTAGLRDAIRDGAQVVVDAEANWAGAK